MPGNKGLFALWACPMWATCCSPRVRAPGIYAADLFSKVKALVAVPFRSGRDYELPIIARTKQEDKPKVTTRPTTSIPVAFVGDDEPGMLWLDWRDLFWLALGRTVTLPGIIVRRGKP